MIEERPESPVQEDQNPILFVPQLNLHLTGGKVQRVLDATLKKSYAPLFHLNWFKRQLALIFEKFESNLKVKLSKKSRPEFLEDIYNLIMLEGDSEFLFKMNEIGMDRNLIQEIVGRFLKITEPLEDLDVRLLLSYNKGDVDFEASRKIFEIEQFFDGIPKDKLLAMRKEVEYWFSVYIDFKNKVVTKFYRLAYKFAKARHFTNPSTSLDDLFKSLIIVLDTAVGKYNAEKGALASYIQTWMKGFILNNGCQFEIGQVFKLYSWNIANLEKKNINTYGISTDSDEYIEKARKSEEENYYNTENPSFFNGLNSTLLKAIHGIKDSNVEIVRNVLNIPKPSV